ncbi:Curved DNA-binding protein [Legionella moravica]|uniref:Curved DNA-binding protein n=1 Tax=Legionella moravica TaxID=39962 RepID=A0A378JXM5_9GAMM|nr:J domain-containing protein [Legionella moravica]KTD37357.1 Curved DNA-binding protein [Legionella moravica]STX63166.1 Curved DNA-binding protein [Legionella moravica]
MPTVYEILGVEPSSTFQELKKAYYRRAIILHPDKNKAEDTTEQFKELQTAWLRVDNAEKAQKYFNAFEHYPSDKKPDFQEDILSGNGADFNWNDWPTGSASSSSSSSGPSFSAPGRDAPVFGEPTEGVRVYRDDVADLFIPLPLTKKFVETITPDTFQNPALFSMIAELLNEYLMDLGSQAGVSEQEALDIINQHSQRNAHIIVRAHVYFRDLLDDRVSETDMNPASLSAKNNKYLYVFKGTQFVEDSIFSIKPVTFGAYTGTYRDHKSIWNLVQHWPELYVNPLSKFSDIYTTFLTSQEGLITRKNRLELDDSKIQDPIPPLDEMDTEQPGEPTPKELQIENEVPSASETRVKEIEEELNLVESSEEAAAIGVIDSLIRISKEYLNHLNQSKDKSELLHIKKSAVHNLILCLENKDQLPNGRLEAFKNTLLETKESIQKHRDPSWQRFIRDCLEFLSSLVNGLGFYQAATNPSPQFFKPSHGERFMEDVSEVMNNNLLNN